MSLDVKSPFGFISKLSFLFIFLIILSGSLFTIEEGHQGLVLKLGVIRTDANGIPEVMNPGLHIKWPFISKALVFDTRLQTLDIDSSRIVTAEKKDVIVDYYVKWSIHDLSKFYTSTGGNIERAQKLLEQQINNSLRAQFGERSIAEVVSDRSSIMQNLQELADASAIPLGVNVLDVRIKAIDLPTEVSTAVFDRMRAERLRVAAEHRAGGKSQAEATRAKAEAVATVTIAKANQEAAIIRAEGDLKASKIYANAYDKDPKFYSFYRSLLAYQTMFSSDDVLILSPENGFFRPMDGTFKNQ